MPKMRRARKSVLYRVRIFGEQRAGWRVPARCYSEFRPGRSTKTEPARASRSSWALGEE